MQTRRWRGKVAKIARRVGGDLELKKKQPARK
jgi:hypothetical protein